MFFRLLGHCSLVCVLMVSAAQAAVVTYTDKTSFMAALSSSSIDNFNDLPTYSSLPAALNRTVGPYGYNVSSVNGLYTAGSAGDIWLSNDRATDPMVFTVNTGSPTAMGGYFFANNISGLLTTGGIRVSINGGLFEQSVTTNSATNFFGWISTDGTPISSLEIRSVYTSTAVWSTVNDLILGQPASPAVPEPSSLAIFVIGACVSGIGAARRRRRVK